MAQKQHIFASKDDDMENGRNDKDDRMASEIAFMMGKEGDTRSLLEKILEMHEEYGCFSF